MTYVVVALDLNVGQLFIRPRSASGIADAATSACAPRIVSLARDGNLATIQLDAHDQARSVRLWRAPSKRAFRVEMPDFNTLQRGLSGQADLLGSEIYRNAHFETVSVNDSGSLIATVAVFFSGAFSGIAEAPFMWSRGRWSPRLFTNALEAQNYVVGAAESEGRFVINANFANIPVDLSLSDVDPTYGRLKTELVVGSHASELGSGISTTMRGENVAGFDAHLSQPYPTIAPHTEAIYWNGGSRHVLGPGIACGINSRNVIVGTDSPYLGTEGHPSIWFSNKRITISRSPGSAYAISDNGDVVGYIGDHGFLYDFEAKKRLVYNLDSLIESHSWHIKAAYAIDNRKEILALGERGSKPSMVLLVPK